MTILGRTSSALPERLSSYSHDVAHTSPAGDEVQLAADHVGVTVAQLERRIHARVGERGLTKAVRDLGQLVVLVQTEAGESELSNKIWQKISLLPRTQVGGHEVTSSEPCGNALALVPSRHRRPPPRPAVVPRCVRELPTAGQTALFPQHRARCPTGAR